MNNSTIDPSNTMHTIGISVKGYLGQIWPGFDITSTCSWSCSWDVLDDLKMYYPKAKSYCHTFSFLSFLSFLSFFSFLDRFERGSSGPFINVCAAARFRSCSLSNSASRAASASCLRMFLFSSPVAVQPTLFHLLYMMRVRTSSPGRALPRRRHKQTVFKCAIYLMQHLPK